MRFALCFLIAAAMSSVASADVVTSFDVDLSPGGQTFANNAATALDLNYAIDGAGNISLLITAPGGGPARWDQIENASAGTTTSAALFGTNFTLSYTGTGNPFLVWPSDYGNAGTGAVLSTQRKAIHPLWKMVSPSRLPSVAQRLRLRVRLGTGQLHL